MTAAIIGASSAWIASLSDSGIRGDLTAMAADGVLTYAEALKLLSDVAARGSVTAVEYSDLKTIVANLNIGVSASDYLASELTKIVNGDPANATWTGGSTSSTSLGNLQAGTTGVQLNELIGKWLEGTDLPNPSLSGYSVTYSTFNLPLYGATGGPVVTDVAQGEVGDCEVCAGLIDMIDNHLSQLESSIVSEGGGVYGVRFYVGGKELWETVNNQLPTYLSNGAVVYMNAFSAAGTGFWADLIEKAYAQLSATGLVGNPATNSYANINGDPANGVLEALSGATNATYYTYSDAGWSYDKQILVDAVQSGEDVIVESYGNTYDASSNQQFVANHAFAVVGYDAATGDFILRNPWGLTGNGYDVQFEASMADVAGIHGDFVVDNSATSQVEISVTGVAAQDIIDAGFGSGAQGVSSGVAMAISSLFSVVDTAGLSIQSYSLQLVGAGSLQLNGAVNLATSAQLSQGLVVVSAGDLAKITYQAGSGGGELLLSAYDGAVWSPTADIALARSATTMVAVPKLATVSASGTIALQNLFGTVGASAGSGASYQIQIYSGGGAFNLNGATNWSGTANQIDIYATDLSKVTYTAAATSGDVSFEVMVYDGRRWSGVEAVRLIVGATAAGAIQAFDNGDLTNSQAVDDSGANTFLNLDGLQSLVAAHALHSISLTDASAPTEIISGSRALADLGALSLISGNYTLDVTSVTAPQAATIQAALKSNVSLAFGSTVTWTAGVNTIDGGGINTFAAPGLSLSQVTLTVDAANEIILDDGAGDVDTLRHFSNILLSNASVGISGNALAVSNGTIDSNGASVSITGSGNAINFVGNGGTATVTGSANTVNLAGPFGDVTLAGTSGNWDAVNSVTGTVRLNSAQTNVIGGGNTIDFVGGSGNAVTLVSTVSGGYTLNGSNGSILLEGSLPTSLLVNGNSESITISAIDTMTLNGNDSAVYANGATMTFIAGDLSDTAVGNSDTINVAAGETIGLTGNLSTIYTTGATLFFNPGDSGDTVVGNNDTLNIAAGDTIGVTSTNSSIYVAGATLFVNATSSADTVIGYSNTINVAAGVSIGITGNYNTIYAAGDTVTMNAGSSGNNVIGYSDVINVASGNVIGFTGSNSTINAGGSTIFLNGGSTQDVVNGGSNTFNVGGGVSLTAGGNGNSITVFNPGDSIQITGTADTFKYLTNFGAQSIAGFNPAAASGDVISLASAEFASIAALISGATMSAGNTLIHGTNGDTLTLVGVNSSSLIAANFSLHS